MDFTEHVRCFLHLLEHKYVKNFMKTDCCGVLCDKYHLIITFQYFMRAEFTENDYTTRNFFLALSLSHDLYDESRPLRHILMTQYFKASKGATRQSFTWAKMLLLQKMQFKGLVDKKICQKLCQIIQHRGFYKYRKEVHTGIIRGKHSCKRCKLPVKEEDTEKRPSMVIKGNEPKRLKTASSDGVSELCCSEEGSDCNSLYLKSDISSGLVVE